jgi:hypothetical protein
MLLMGGAKSGGVHHPFINGGLGCNDSARVTPARGRESGFIKKCGV